MIDELAQVDDDQAEGDRPDGAGWHLFVIRLPDNPGGLDARLRAYAKRLGARRGEAVPLAVAARVLLARALRDSDDLARARRAGRRARSRQLSLFDRTG